MTTGLEALPGHQRAILEDEAGQPVLANDVALPALLPKTLLIKTTAVAINPFDYKMPKNFPSAGATIGIDFVGRIVRIDTEAASLRPELSIGDTVCGFVHGSNPAVPDGGAFAEYVRAPAQLVYRVPAAMKVEEAATYGCALASMCLALWKCLELPATPRQPLSAESPAYVLVYGGSTATGTMALQLLKL
jgi:NADPH:quinone reductase-like Zn-dependent oxidoreductase